MSNVVPMTRAARMQQAEAKAREQGPRRYLLHLFAAAASAGNSPSGKIFAKYGVRNIGDIADADVAAAIADFEAVKPPAKKMPLSIVKASTIKARRLRWIWDYHLALGQHTIIAGVQGDGKTLLVYRLIAAVTNGSEWPGTKQKAPLGNVIVMCAEETQADVMLPRLAAAGADLNRVYILQGTIKETGTLRKFNLQADIKRLEAMAEMIGDVKMITIDPISSYLGGDIDSHNNTELRDALDPIKDLAEKVGCAIVSISHFNKASKGVSALNRIIGSIAFTAAPRAAFVVLRDEMDRAVRYFLPVKMNLMAEGACYGMSYTIEEVQTSLVDELDGGPIRAPAIVWREQDSRTADSMLNPIKEKEEGSGVAKAMEFLRKTLRDGPMLKSDIVEEADGMGMFSYATLRRAADALGVGNRKRPEPGGHGPYEWYLPEPEAGEFVDDGSGDRELTDEDLLS